MNLFQALSKRPIALVVAPWKGRTQRDAERTDDGITFLLERGWLPVFLPDMLKEFLEDETPGEREVALECSASLVRVLANTPRGVACFVLEGRVSEGMALDLEAWTEERRSRGFMEKVYPLPGGNADDHEKLESAKKEVL